MSLAELLDRLCELRPDICRKSEMPPSCYYIGTGNDQERFVDLDKDISWISLGRWARLKNAIARSIEAEIDKPGNLWTGYVTGQSLADGKFARIYSPEFPYNPDTDRWAIERRMQENQTIALVGCFVEALEQEAEAS
jgi:hypothetical protein